METIKARTFFVAVAFVFFGMISTAAAQPIHPGCPERPKYEKDAKALAGNWFKRAQDLVAEKKFDEALAGFGCSYSLVPHPATLFNMSQTARLAKKNKLALELIHKYLRENPDGPYAKPLEEQLIELVKTLDEPLDGPNEPDKDTDNEPNTDKEPDTETTQTTEEPLPPPPPTEDDSSELNYGLLAYSSFGVAGASAAVGVIMTVLSVQAKQDAEDSHGGSYQKAKDFEEKSKRYRIGAILSYTGAALLTAAGIVLMVKAPDEDEDTESTQVRVVPTLGGLVVKGVF